MPITILPIPSFVEVKQSGVDLATTVAELPTESAQDPTTLFWASTRTFAGWRSALVTLAASLGGVKSIRHLEGPYYELVAQFSGLTAADGTQPSSNSQLQTLWTLEPSRLVKDLWLLPSAAAVLAKITKPAKRAWLRAAIETLARGESEMPAVPKDTATKAAGPAVQVTLASACTLAGITKAEDVAEMANQLGSRARGSTSYPVPSIVLTKTRIAPPDATLVYPDFANYGRIHTTAALLRREPSIIPAIKAAINADADMKAGYWLKEMPALGQRDAFRVEVQTHWTFEDAFDPYIYGAAIT
jgi:hypothetical protein